MRTALVLVLVLAAAGAASGAEDEPYFRVSPASQRAVEGQPVRLRCEAEPRQAVIYSWKLDGRELAASPRRRLHRGDLVISRLSRLLDSGDFVCVATQLSSGRSVESSPARIDVQWISEASVHLQQPKQSAHLRPGSKIELRCQVDGSGELKYEWFRNTQSIQQQQPQQRVQMRRNLLLIEEARPEADNGVYRCLARNEAGASAPARTLALVVPSNQSANAKLLPRDATVRRGESASFSCAFDGAERVDWYWQQDQGPIETDAERRVQLNVSATGASSELHILQAQDRHKGFYSCHGIGRDCLPQIYTAELQIAYLKNLSEASLEPELPELLAVVAEGQELQVTCLNPGGLPTPRIFWRDPQGRLISDEGPVRVQDDTLVVAKARASRDQGNYSCWAENLAGSNSLTLRLAVAGPPQLREPLPPRSLGLAEDQSASLSCLHDAYSRASWLKDGEPLAGPAPLGPRLLESPGNSTLVFRAVRPADRGSYVCELTSPGFPPLRSSPAKIAVEEALKFSPPPVSRRLELNSTAKVSCKAQGSSLPTVKWYKEGSTRLPKHVVESNGSLQFGGVAEEDRGNYTCVASNAQGEIKHTIQIDVVVAPKFSVGASNVTALEGESAMLHCSAEGSPKPAIHWDKDGSQMWNNALYAERFVKMPNDSLHIKEVYLSDEGKYGCTAGNSGGLKRQELYLSVRAAATEPGSSGYGPDLDSEARGDGSMMTKTVLVTLGVAAAYMLLVVGLMLYCRCRRRRRKQRYLQQELEDKAAPAEEQRDEPQQPQEIASSERRRQHAEAHKSDGAGTDTAHSQTSGHSKRSKASYDKLLVARSRLGELKPLGRGEFGQVFASKYRVAADDDDDDARESAVMVKTLTNSRDEGVLHEFKRHLDLLHKLDHEALAKLVGLCREDGQPDYMILEYTDWGDLKQFLLVSSKAPHLTVPQLLSLADQAAQALKHISDQRFVHKDVAARNCLVTSKLRLKLTLACMSKEPYQQEYSKHCNQVIPLRWMPREAVFDDEFSSKSDVYAYAVLVWEMFQRGELPHRKLNDATVLEQLKAQSLAWSAPKAAPARLQQLQTKCWSHDPRERPSCEELAAELREIVAEQP